MPTKKARTAIPPELSVEVLFESDRTCCVCNEPGSPIQIHHIDEDPSNNVKANLAVLCLHCHEQTQLQGGFGRKLTPAVVTKYRDDWHRRVATRRAAVAKIVPVPSIPIDLERLSDRDHRLGEYLLAIPGFIQSAQALAQPQLDTGVTSEVMEGCSTIIDSMHKILLGLSRFYDHRQFEGDPETFFSDFIRSRFKWHRAHLEVDGPWTGGTMIGPLAASAVIDDVRRMVEDMVFTLTQDVPEFDHGRSIIQLLRLNMEGR